MLRAGGLLRAVVAGLVAEPIPALPPGGLKAVCRKWGRKHFSHRI